MLDDLFDMFGGGDDDDDNRRNRRRADGNERQGGIRGFISRLFGLDGEDEDNDPRQDRRGRRYDAGSDEYDGQYARSGRRNRRPDRDDDDDGGFFDFGD